ncbi:hypothetical protein HO173_000035 [Letharia columbiana]|uniref:Uncharacterized protein n=1 Tax=Letharia columbiana TaxID=112416 RepID=A0A8H6G6B1_9LECA|nr:uncharacterized protein HO173_000035 [Letharia columbiana]KAF6241325.1 hypothetical protein HO173_000035 [Letharia columbiana]
MTPAPTPATTHPPTPTFPPHPAPRNWLITACTSPIGIAIARQVLSHGDNVIAGLNPRHLAEGHGDGGEEEGDAQRGEEFREFWRECEEEGWKERCKGVELDGRSLVGTVEELAASPRTQTLVREQFESNFFGPVNCIKAALPTMRRRNSGHVMILTGITGHLGTPGLGMYCAAGWALEGFCDSLAYEIAPFNIKMTIVQPTMEIGVLTNKIISAPSMPQYSPDNNPAPLFRGIIGGLLDRLDLVQQNGNYEPASLAGDRIQTLYPKLPPEMQSSLLAETINAITAIGGHDNPPARHIVGHEGVASVKEKLKTVSEELEDFVDCSCAVDIDDGHGIEDANGSIDGML